MENLRNCPEMDEYQWNLLDLRELQWKSIGETTTQEGKKNYSTVEDEIRIKKA